MLGHQMENGSVFTQFMMYSLTGMAVLSLNGTWLKVNSEFCDLVGYTQEELIGLSFQQITHSMSLVQELSQLQQLFAGKSECYQMSKGWIHKDGSVVKVKVSVVIVRDEQMNPNSYIYQMVKDDTSLTTKVENISTTPIEAEVECYRKVVENGFQMITRHSPIGEYIYVSASCHKVLGYTREEMLGKDGVYFMHPDDVHNGYVQFQSLLNGEEEGFCSCRLRKKDGTYLSVEAIIYAIRDHNSGDLLEIIICFRDVTLNKIAELKLRESEDIYLSLFQYHPDPIYHMDLEGNFTSINPAFEQLLGVTSEQILKHAVNFREMLTEEYMEDTEHHYQLAANGLAQRYVSAGLGAAGNEIKFDITNVPIIQGDRVVGVYGIARDVTEKEILWKKLVEIENLYNLISLNAQDVITSSTPDGVIEYVSPGIKNLLGYECEEMIGKSAQEFWVEEDMKGVYDAEFPMDWDGGTTTYRAKHKDGQLIWIETMVRPIRNETGNIVKILAVGRDIRERKLAELELLESEQRYRSLIQTIPDAIVLVDEEGWLFINDAGVKMFGGTAPEPFYGKWHPELLHPDYHYSIITIIHDIIEHQKPLEFIEQEWFTFHGAPFPAEVMGAPIYFRNKPAAQLIIRDISKRKITEKLMLQSEKLSVAGQLAAGIAHEIRNPLTAIKGFIHLLQSGYGSPEKYFSIIMSEMSRIELILSELLLLAKPHVLQSQPVHIQTLLQQVVALLDTQAIMNNIQIITRLEQNPLWLNCDENQMKQVIINLLKNAIEVMPDGGEILLNLERKQDRLFLYVIDHGCGIPKDIMAQLGTPFFTTKENGTGLGLMISRNIIESHKGTLSIESQVGAGTTIIIELPLEI